MKNNILPIGSIVSVGKLDLMICSYFDYSKDLNGEKYDYICCPYPHGLTNDIMMIKKNNIETVKFIGFQDARFVELKKELENNHES